MVQRAPRPCTPPPITLPFQDEEGDPDSWYWEEHAGGMVVNFGKHRGKKIHEVSLSYLLWCRRTFEEDARNRPFLNALDYYYSGLEDCLEQEYERFIVPFGQKHRGKTIRQCRDKNWLVWARKKPELVKKHPLFFQAVKKWLDNPNHQQVVRDIGESLAATEYEDDLNLHGDGEDLYSDDEPTAEDMDFIDDDSLPNSSFDQSEPNMDDFYDRSRTPLSLENEDARSSRSSASIAHSTGTSGVEVVANEQHVITKNEGEAQMTDGGTNTNNTAQTVNTTTTTSSPFIVDGSSSDGEQSYVDSDGQGRSGSTSRGGERMVVIRTALTSFPSFKSCSSISN
ncbi:hypothetical protein JB92DRAFT_2861766 [Gautieria morchelliformis]|nr:hypothetical protein JB92DRAFT_2861766 [Gautieria morchelliformis]